MLILIEIKSFFLFSWEIIIFCVRTVTLIAIEQCSQESDLKKETKSKIDKCNLLIWFEHSDLSFYFMYNKPYLYMGPFAIVIVFVSLYKCDW